MERLIKDRSQRNEANYSKLLEVLSELEKKQGGKFGQLIQELKQELETMINGTALPLEKTINQNHKSVLELVKKLETKVEGRNAEVVRDLMAEIEKTRGEGQKSLDVSVDRLLNLLKQLTDKLDSKTGELSGNFSEF